MFRFITPFQRGDVFRQFFDQGGLMHDDVAPEFHLESPFRRPAGQLLEKIQIDSGHAAFPAQRGALPFAEFDRFIASDIELARREIRQEFRIQRIHEFQRFPAGLEHGLHRLSRGYEDIRRIAFRQILVFRMAQPPPQMPETVQIRYQFDEIFPAESVQFHDLFRGERREARPDPFMGSKRESVFHVKLERIIPQSRQTADHFFQRVHGRDLVAGDVQHVAAFLHRRPVLDPAAGHAGGILQQLGSGLHPVEKARVIRGFDLDRTGRLQLELIPFGGNILFPGHDGQQFSGGRFPGTDPRFRDEFRRQPDGCFHDPVFQRETGIFRENDPGSFGKIAGFSGKIEFLRNRKNPVRRIGSNDFFHRCFIPVH